MGLKCSTIKDLENNENLEAFSGKNIISPNDPFWNQLLSFSLKGPKSRAEQLQLEELTNCYCRALVENNQHTGNFTSLLKVFIARAEQLKSSVECGDKILIWQSCNAIYVIRNLCKYFAENMSEESMLEQFEARSLTDRQMDLESGAVISSAGLVVNFLDKFIETLQNIVIEVPVFDFTYDIHMEAITAFLVVLSIQMFLPSPTLHGSFTKKVMTCSKPDHSVKFIKVLLQHFIEQKVSPSGNNESHGGSIVLSLASAVASGMWTIVTRRREQDIPTAVMQNLAISSLGHRSSLLLLSLISYTDESMKDLPGCSRLGTGNPYHDALQGFRHIQGSSTVNPSSATFHLNLSRLFQSLCSTQYQEASTLLLYFLVHKNPEVRAFILSKTDIDKLIVPILKILYTAPEQNSHHIYMALIILLILTEDDHFNQLVHESQVKNVDWYKDRLLHNVSLGDVMILVILRTIQYNMTRMRDRYLHTNCLAALANMSAHFRNLHSYACQRIFSLITLLVKKWRRLEKKLTGSNGGTANVNNATGSVALEMVTHQDYASELSVVIEVLRMLLEILNSCLTGSGMRQNVNLIYALLRQKSIIDEFRNHPGLQDILQNIDTMVAFFDSCLAKSNNEYTMTTEEVHEEIKKAMLRIPSHQLKKVAELKFRYVEEESPEEFFVPYIWSLTFNKSNVFWNPGCVQLFALDG